MAPAQCNYDIHDKELLAIVHALREWKRYVRASRHQVKMLTDYKNLAPFMTTKERSEQQIRCMEVISGYNFKNEFRPGKEEGKPDALARRKQDMPGDEDERVTQKERILLLPKYFSQIEEIEIMEIEEESNIQQESSRDITIQNMQQELEKGTKKMKGITLGLCQWKDGYLWYQGKIWVPDKEKIRTDIIRQHHDIPIAGHGETAKTTELIQRKYYWPSMRETIKQYVKGYDVCQ